MNENINFWDGVTKVDCSQLTDNEKLEFCKSLNKMLEKSPEVAKIFYNTQVYNEIVNDVTTRGEHSVGVAIVAERLATQKAKYDGKSEIEQQISCLLAKALGYMHDLGHTPFGHDGEGALNSEMERFEVTADYKAKREVLYGKEYTIKAGDTKAKKMCYEHNETSAVISQGILERFANENGYIIDKNAMQYMKTGILAHSTSRVKDEPQGDEQKAVRLADKVAYIPQDELDLLKQGVLKIDDLTPEEQSLLGLNENVLTAAENQQYNDLQTDTDKNKYIEKIKNEKLLLKEQLRNIDTMTEFTKKKLFQTMDSKVHEMQAEIASKCFVKTKDGEIKLDGRKSRVDFYEKVYKNGKPKNRELTDKETQGSELYKILREAQKMPARNQEEIDARKVQVDKAAKDYREFLTEKEHINPMLATLWVTKAKYQDSFIRDEFPKVTQEKDGQIKTETLNEINRRNENGWKMKSTFQFFYSNMDQIPEEFTNKYQSGKDSLYTNQQIVSAFIASFTNKGLDELYNGLLERDLLISREDAIKRVQELRPDINVKKLVSKDVKLADQENPDIKHKIVANDILEYLYEETVQDSIVAGKNGIPPIEHTNLLENMIESTRDKSVNVGVPNLLLDAQKISEQEITSQDIHMMVSSVMERQNSREIQKHIDEVNKNDEGR